MIDKNKKLAIALRKNLQKRKEQINTRKKLSELSLDNKAKNS